MLLDRLLKRLDRIEDRERRAIANGRTSQAVAWGILANETWAKCLHAAPANDGLYRLPAQKGPAHRSEGDAS